MTETAKTPETAEAASCDVGLVGLAVMGQNLALNMADHGLRVAVYNRTTGVTEAFAGAHPPGSFPRGGGLVAARSLEALVAALRPPRRVVLMVKAGAPTDAVIDALAPLLARGDLIVDGGNALFTDTRRREAALRDRGLRFIGSGVSGGEEGARFGPSLMPGGSMEAWSLLEPIWTAIAAKVDPSTGKPLPGAAPGRPVTGGVPCTVHVGADGAGHYVKMVHNGIEYADMQLICEAYHLLGALLHKDAAGCAEVFAGWNEGDLDSFLIEVTAAVLRQKDPVTGQPFVEVVLDTAGQKGTGKWTSASSLELDVPCPTIAEAVFQRFMSAQKDARVRAARVLQERRGPPLDISVEAIRDALYCSKICAYAQGFGLMSAAARAYGWTLDLGAIAQIFRGGCIIRARFLQKITEAYAGDPALDNLLLDPYFSQVLEAGQRRWREVVAAAALAGVPIPAFASSLSYFDSFRSERLPANLLQAQRDYFGAHTYERVDAPRGKSFHLDWQSPERAQLEV